jgi:hypothetical protein
MIRRPGSSEIYTVLVRCALAPGGKHKIKLRLRYDNRVTIESPCLPRVADAHDRLVRSGSDRASIHDLSCGRWINRMYDAIRARVTHEFTLLFCGDTCKAYVPAWHNDCPFQIFDQDTGPTHHVDRGTTLGFWNRIVRIGRVPYSRRVR